MNQSSSYIRWYDRQPKLSEACKLLFGFPDEIKSLISEAVLIIADREIKQKEQREQMRSLGSEKILGLYKSKNRRREYDINPYLHQAMNYLYLLSEKNRDFMAEHILKMVHYIQHYLQTCHITETPPSMEDVATITNLYIHSGDPEVKSFLKQLHYEFCLKLQDGKSPTLPNPLLDIIENVTQINGSGMKISHRDLPL